MIVDLIAIPRQIRLLEEKTQRELPERFKITESRGKLYYPRLGGTVTQRGRNSQHVRLSLRRGHDGKYIEMAETRPDRRFALETICPVSAK